MTLTANLRQLTEFLGSYNFDYVVDIGGHATATVMVTMKADGEIRFVRGGNPLAAKTSAAFMKAFNMARIVNAKHFTFEVA